MDKKKAVAAGVLTLITAAAVAVASKAKATGGGGERIGEPVPDPSKLPWTGGKVTVTGTTTYPDGSALKVLVNGIADPAQVTVSQGRYLATVTLAENDSPNAVSDEIKIEGP